MRLCVPGPIRAPAAPPLAPLPGVPRLFAALLLAVLLLGALLCAMPPSAAAMPNPARDDEVLPGGVWRVRIDVSTRTDSKGANNSGRMGPLLEYLVPDETVSSQITGDVQRRWLRTEVSAIYGLSDTWNLVAALPYVQVEQTSTLDPGAGGTTVQDAVAALASRSERGPGALRLASLHRPVFTDRQAFVHSYGLDVPLQSPVSPYDGRGTLLLDIPTPRLFANLHYTFYPTEPRMRVELRGEIGIAETRSLELASGGSTSVTPGNDVSGYIGLGRDWAPIYTELGLQFLVQARAGVSDQGQNDTLTEITAHLRIEFGNLAQLEQGPVSFPNAFALGYVRTLRGVNVPQRNELQLGWRFYF